MAEKLRLLFDATHPEVHDVSTQSVWAAGELLRFNGNFNLYVRTRDLVKQEGIIFRHVLRLILLCGEFEQVDADYMTGEDCRRDLKDIADRLTASCREVDPTSTDQAIPEGCTQPTWSRVRRASAYLREPEASAREIKPLAGRFGLGQTGGQTCAMISTELPAGSVT